MYNYNAPEIKYYRRILRNEPTPFEMKVWSFLKNKQLGVKFRRQHSIENYIVDFYCCEKKIAVEIDGDSHFSELVIEYDKKRSDILKKHDICVIRFTNREVVENIEWVVEEIKKAVATTPTSSP